MDRFGKRDRNEECQTEIFLPYDRGGMPEVKSQMPETISSPSPLLYSAQLSLLRANAGRYHCIFNWGGGVNAVSTPVVAATVAKCVVVPTQQSA